MGWVTTIMLSFSNEECWEDGEDEPVEPLDCRPMEQINAWIDAGDSDGSWGRLVEIIGPTYEGDIGQGMDANLVGGGFKNFNIYGFIEVVEGQKWKERKAVQLWIKDEEDEMFTLIKLRRTSNSSKTNLLPEWRKITLRLDLSVGIGERVIEEAFGFPRGSIWLVNPDKQKARSGKHVGTLLDDWGKLAKKKPTKKAAVKKWTKSELSTLKKEYPKVDTRKLAKKLNRTLEAVRFQAKKYGLKKYR